MNKRMYKLVKVAILLSIFCISILGIRTLYVAVNKGYDLPNAWDFAWQMLEQKIVFTHIEPSFIHSQTHWMGDIQDKALNESSGLASSNLSDDVLWSFNDSGDSARIFALSTSGAALGQWQINIPDPTDWEAMDSFVIDDIAYLLLADTGDNLRWRPHVSLIVIAEPPIDSNNEIPLEPIWQKNFRYPDGPRDIEAVAVDTSRGEVLFLSKRNMPNELYGIPLAQIRALDDTMLVADKIADIHSIPRLSRGQESLFGGAAPYMGMPTGMSINANHLLVTTMQNAYLLNRDNLVEPALAIRLPYIGQREAITFARSTNNSAYVSRERVAGKEVADIFRVDFALPQTPSAE
jgi:hypothetical protein